MTTDADADYTVRAVNRAMRLWAHQMGYPQIGEWEKTTLEEWRDWLAGLLEEATDEQAAT